MIKILTGLVALGIVVMIHELGHFIAARLCGVTVETFSIGWGPVLFRRKFGTTEFRISALPLGGYCGMKGENEFKAAIDTDQDAIPRDRDSFYGAHPLKRIAIALAGPFSNLFFSVLVFAIVSSVGYSYSTYENRIVPAAAYTDSPDGPAEISGLIEGDRIVSLDGTTVATFADIQQYIGANPERDISVQYVRDGISRSTRIRPVMDRKTGTGKIGVYPYVPLEVAMVSEGSAADTSGIRINDLIIEVDGAEVRHFIQFSRLLESKPEQVVLTVRRGDLELRVPIVMLYREDGSIETGMKWKSINITIAGTGPINSIINGFSETAKTLTLTVKSIGLLFRGVDLSEAVSGPLRITMMIGEVAKSSITGVAELLAIICVSLFLMNLLPIPILDGGTVLFGLLELMKGKPIRPRTLYYVQFIGVGFILFVFVFALFGDIKYLIK